jgi:hypothetical protein
MSILQGMLQQRQHCRKSRPTGSTELETEGPDLPRGVWLPDLNCSYAKFSTCAQLSVHKELRIGIDWISGARSSLRYDLLVQ